MRYLHDYAEGERLVTFCLVKSREIGVTSNQSEYMNLELGDSSGSIVAKLWDVTEEHKQSIQVKSIVKIDAQVQSYRGKKQLIISRIRLTTQADEVAMETLVPTSKFTVEELWDRLEVTIREMQSEKLIAVIRTILSDEDLFVRLKSFPAGVKMHHNYYSGLLEHIVSLLEAAKRLVPLYPQIDKDVLYATCILHDIGKLYELTDAFAPEYSTPGQLMGHLVMGVDLVSEACRTLGIDPHDNEVLHLKHCILSHHGDLEFGWGSAVSGKTPTAIMFHYLDQIDSKMNAVGQAIADGEAEEEWIYSPALRRKVWRGY
ncbi:3'-5' exoribonuclease YhaM family protein [Brevibacillus sp. SYSU BS000544]|uniref:3'-5' exoribonuclease YhaM family protein n=1 Tax=Brevibacillus sp. SYSU BS000544 TaxID=3416443 RepID=UPI003CE544A4